MNMQKQNGITIVALIVTVIIMLILVGVSIKFGTEEIEKSKIEDIKSNMLLIQGRSKIIKDKHKYDEENSKLEGIKISEATADYTINSSLQTKLNEILEGDFYILRQEDLNNNGLSSIKVSKTEFYIVDYNTCEIYYSLGVNGKYALSEI